MRQPSVNRLAALICVLFVALCARYASLVELWGDEWYTLHHARLSWSYLLTEHWAVDRLHLPTYLVAIKALVAIVGESNVTILRVCLALPFALGLWTGYRTLCRWIPPERSLLALLSAAVVPPFVFYATNLRMYSLLFLASMVYIDRLSRLVELGALASATDRRRHALAAGLVAVVDYPGVFLLAAGTALLAVHSPRGRRLRDASAALIPAGLVLVYAVSVTGRAGIQAARNMARSGTEALVGGIDAFAVVKQTFLSLRPMLELTSPAQPLLLLAVGLPSLIAVAVAASAAHLLRRRNRSALVGVLLVASFYWLAAAPFGLAVPRAFLAAMFFMPVMLVVEWKEPPRGWVVLNRVLFGLLLVTNLGLAIRPTLRLYSLIPVEQVAGDVVEQLETGRIGVVVLSADSLNVNVVADRLRREDRLGPVELRAADADFASGSLPPGEFLYLSHMAENGPMVDVAALARSQGREVESVGRYVELASLPYNAWWKRQLTSRGGQSHLLTLQRVGAVG